jgi:cysteine desulfurase
MVAMVGERSSAYLDYNASTPLDSRVFESMKEWYVGPPANAASRTHVYGQRARVAVERAREEVAKLIGASPAEIYFTSGATESNNLALLGLAGYGNLHGRRHIVSTSIEHKSVLEPLDEMRRRGFEVELVPVTSCGYIEPEAIEKRIRKDTLLVSVMHANNETGIIQPVQEVSDLLAGSKTFFHTDAAQTFGKEVENLKALQCDFMSISGHKIYGPQGIGAIYVRKIGLQGRPLEPLMYGGGQERGFRPGTLPVPLIVGLGTAARLAAEEYIERNMSAATFRRQFLEALGEVKYLLNGDLSRSQPHVLNVCFPGVDNEALMLRLRAIAAVSNGSACSSTSHSPSHVLAAMGFDDDRINGSIRISWGPNMDQVQFPQLLEAISSLQGI